MSSVFLIGTTVRMHDGVDPMIGCPRA